MKRIAVAVSAAILAVVLSACGQSELQQADELYDEGSYREALEIYESLGGSDGGDVEEKIVDCKRWLFVDYARDRGEIKTDHTVSDSSTLENTKVVARDTGDIEVFYERWDTPFGTWTNTKYEIVIPYEGSEAEVTGYCMLSNSGARAEQNGTGTLDMGLYTAGDDVDWDDYDDTATTRSGLLGETSLGVNVLNFNGNQIELMLNDLSDVLAKSGTGLTLKDLGFEKYV